MGLITVLHDHDLAEAIVDRVLEKGRLIVVDGPSYRIRHRDSPLARRRGRGGAEEDFSACRSGV